MQGLWWYDDSPTRPDIAKIEQARARYQHRYGSAPTLCLVNPGTSGLDYLQKVAQEKFGIKVETSRHIPPCNFHIGQNGNGQAK